MATKKTIFLEIQIDGVDRVIKTGDDLKEAIKGTRDELNKVERGSEAYDKLQKQLGALKEVQKETRAETRDAGREFVIAADKGERSYRALNAELVNARRAFKELGQAQREGAEGQKLLRQIQALDSELKDIDATIGQFQRNVGNYQSAFEGLGNTLSTTLSALGGFAIGATIGDILQDGAVAVRDLTIQFRQLRGEIQNFTGASGEELDAFTTQISAISDTFDVEQKEILLAANALTKNLTGDFSESLSLIETGFLGGLDASGEFLDILKEYPTFFAEAGLTGEQFLQVINANVEQGVFSDKGVDAVKEASIALRELTDPTRDALNAIGLTGEQIEEVIGAEGIGSAIGLITTRLGEFKEDSQETGVVLADVFKGAGEDAGVQFIRSLANIDNGLEGIVDQTNELTVAQQNQLTVNQKFAAVQNEVAKQFSDLVGSTENFGTQLKTVLLQVLLEVVRGFTILVETLKAVPEFIRENRIAIGLLVTGLVTLNSQLIATKIQFLANAAAAKGQAIATNAAALAQRVLNVALKANPIGIVITAVGALVAGLTLLAKKNDNVYASLQGLGAVARELFTVIGEAVQGFAQGFRKVFEGDIKGGLKDIGTALVKSNPIGIAINQGARLGDAFTKARDKAIKDRAEQRSAIEIDDQQAKQAGQKAGQNVVEGLEEELDNDDSKINLDAIVELDAEKAVEGSVKAIKDEISKLQSDLDNTAPADQASLIERIVNLEAELEKAKEIRQQLREEITKNLGLETTESEVENAIEIIKQARFEAIREVQENELLTEEQKEERRKAIVLQSEIRVATEKKRLLEEGSAAAIEAEVDIADKRAELAELSEQQTLDAKIQSIERERELRLQALQNQNLDEETLALERAKINEQADIELLQQKANQFEEGSAERLALENEIADKEKAIAAEVAEFQKEKIQEVNEARRERIQELLAGASEVVGNLQQIQENRYAAEISALEERYGREIEAAEGNKDKQEQLQEELDQKKKAIEKEQFERGKELQKLQVRIQTAQGIINILASPTTIPDPFGQIFKGIRIAFLLAQAQSQLSAIEAAQFSGQEGLTVDPEGNVKKGKKAPRGQQDRPRQADSRSPMPSIFDADLGEQQGRLHSDGGNKFQTPSGVIEIERGEWLDLDENGNLVVVNRKSSAAFRDQLKQIKGLQFPGKAKMLSGMNQYKGFGIKLAQQGAIVPNVQAAASLAGQATNQGSGNVQVTLKPSDIDQIASRVGESVKAGAKTGVMSGAELTQRRAEREQALQKAIGKQ